MYMIQNRLPIVHKSKGVRWIALLGTLFNMYIAVFNASSHKNKGKDVSITRHTPNPIHKCPVTPLN